jgi:transcriptional regulator with XRE-family HTH domain
MKHGEILRQYIKGQGLKYQRVGEMLGFSSKNTIGLWMAQETFRNEQFAELLRIFPDIMEHYPEVNITRVRNMASEPMEVYGYRSSEERKCQDELNRFREAYYSMLERHNSLQDRYIHLQHEHMELQDRYKSARR